MRVSVKGGVRAGGSSGRIVRTGGRLGSPVVPAFCRRSTKDGTISRLFALLVVRSGKRATLPRAYRYTPHERARAGQRPQFNKESSYDLQA